MKLKDKLFNLKEKNSTRSGPRCLLCPSFSFRPLYFKFGRSIIRCQKCGLVYAFPQPSDQELQARYESPLFFNEYLKSFQATPEGYDPLLIEKHFRIFLDLIGKIYFPGSKLLDIGCGPGFFLKAAIEGGWRGEGLEISNQVADYAEKIVKVPVYLGSLEALFLPPESYDLITMLDLLEHLSHPLETLQAAYRVLKKGGYLFACTPDFHSLNRLILGKAWAVLSPAEHLFYFTHKSLVRLFQSAGFKIKGTWNLLIFNPIYFHGKPNLRTKLWSRLHSWLEKQSFMEKLHGVEYLELMKLAGSSVPKSNLKQGQKIRRNLYLKMKSWLRGDMLCILAQK